MAEFLMCKDMGWTWNDLQSTPAYVIDLWSYYRNISVQISNSEVKK
jgi:hypothetical protein